MVVKSSRRRNPILPAALESLESRWLMSGVWFNSPVSVGTPTSADQGTLADLDNDGKLDMVVMRGANRFVPAELGVMRGNGDGTFASSGVFAVGGLSPGSGRSPSMAVGDLNHDGKPDIAAVNFLDNAFYVFLGNGDTTFQSPTRVPLTPSIVPSGVGIGDFNGDGYGDVVAAATDNTRLVFSWGGSGAFPASQSTVTMPQAGFTVDVADFDLDGSADVGVAGPSSYTVVRKLQTATPTIDNTTGINTGFSIVAAAVGNLRGVGQRPSAVMTQNNGANNARITVVPRPTEPVPAVPYAVGLELGGVGVADFNRDGFDDVITGTQGASTLCFLSYSNGDGTLSVNAFTPVNVGAAIYDIATGDINNDGYPDAVLMHASGGASVVLQSAQSLVVTTAVDENDGTAAPAAGTGTSFREAYAYARSLGGTQTITFAPALGNANAILNVASSWMTVDSGSNITIRNDTGRITINGNGQNLGWLINGGGTLSLRNLTISNFAGSLDDHGGAVYVSSGGRLNVDNATFTGNFAAAMGGAIYADPGSHTTIRNSTFYANNRGAVALNAAGGGSITLENNTFANNNGGGVRVLGGTATLRNNIIANNTNGQDLELNSGSLTGGNNIVLTGTTTGLTGTITADPMLNAPAYNGGPANTMSLQLGSPAINSGATLAGVTTDQRGVARPQNGAFDIGAFEARVGAASLGTNTLTVRVEDPPVNLAQATNPSPAGGTFSGPGVSNGFFNPAGLPLGPKTISYVAPSVPDTDLPGSTTLTINVVAHSVLTSAYVWMSMSANPPLEGTPFIVDVGNLLWNDQGTQATLLLTNLAPDADYLLQIPSVGAFQPLEFFILRGDANRDRSVNISDFAVLASRFNQPGTFSQGDFDYDGSVNISDFSILAAKFNTGLTGSATARTPTAAFAPASIDAESPFSSRLIGGLEEEMSDSLAQ